jgi:hypothetical protein
MSMPVNKRKVPYLETSPEQFQQQDGNGFYNMDSHSPTGKNIAAILRPLPDSLSPTELPSKHPLADTLEQMMEKEPENLRGNGDSGETSCDLLLFWNPRREIPQK